MRIYIFAFLLTLQSLTACQQEQKMIQPLTASIGFPSAAKAQPSVVNVVFKSVDGGQTWQDVSDGLPMDIDTRCLFISDNKVYLGASDGIYRGNATAATPVWQKDPFLDKSIDNFSMGRGGLFAGGYDAGFYQELVGSGTWTARYKSLESKPIRTIFEAADGTLLVGSDVGIFKSSDEGKTWNHVFTGGYVGSIETFNGTLFASEIKGLLRSTDGRDHWEVVLTDGGMARNSTLIDGGIATITTYFRTEGPWTDGPDDGAANHLRFSADGGTTWQSLDNNLPAFRFVYDIKQVGSNLLCSTDSGLFRSADKGKSWEQVRKPGKNGLGFNMKVTGNVIFAVLAGGGC